jgi:hypothetical protein
MATVADELERLRQLREPSQEGSSVSMTEATWKKYLDAAEAAYPGPRRFKKWKMAGRPPLTVDDDIKCGADVQVSDDDEDWEPCGNRSRFIVERFDEDESFGTLGGGEESCEEHLEEAVCGMIGGDDDVRAVVALRWDKCEEADGAASGDACRRLGMTPRQHDPGLPVV